MQYADTPIDFILNIIFIFVSYLGKKGHVAFQRIDRIYEIQDEAYMNQETEITIL